MVLTLVTLSISAKSTMYSFQYMTENSDFIGSIKITNKSKLIGDNDFLCGYQYNFQILQVEKDNLQNYTFWSMSNQYKIDENYQIFLTPSNTIVDERINDWKLTEGNEVNIEDVMSFQSCKQIIPSVGISADGNGIFKIEIKNNNKKFISFNGYNFTNSELNKVCNIRDHHPDSLVKLNCIQKHTKKILDNKQLDLQKIYDSIINKSN